MTEWEKTTGGKLLAIPHNGNLSNGRMFALSTFAGNPMSKSWAEERQKWEPLFEAIQMKGQSESHPSLSTTDEFAVNYELWDRGNLILMPKTPGMIQYEYVREALKNGLKVEQDLGTNPFKYGMAGGTDTHNGLTAAEEENFFAKFPSAEPQPGSMERERDEVRRPRRQGLGDDRGRLHRRVGDREHARRVVGRDEAARDVRDQRPAHDRAVLRRLRFHRGRHLAVAGRRRLRQGRSDGRRSEDGAGWQGADVPGGRAEGSDTAATSIASRSSRAGSTRPESRRRRSTTSSGAMPRAAGSSAAS